ncbi:MAG TPA: biotin/lipoyl-containing protein [Candidatus Polarisedimenticolaceae bacterium]|nr:biotin/lipoyl-containing protein [Candidatus Polarisedimenticolaceae bacterium]
MTDAVLLGMTDRSPDGTIRVLSPAIGWWCDPPHRGAWVGPGSSIGTIRRLNRRYRLVLPEGAAGRVAGAASTERVRAVEFGQLLFELAPVGESTGAVPSEDEALLGHPPGAGLEPGMLAIVAPSDGVFYRRASPEAPPFVEVGARVRLGQPVGLVEVMKTFNQIVYDGPAFPMEAEVLELRARDAEEVRAGQILLVVR